MRLAGIVALLCLSGCRSPATMDLDQLYAAAQDQLQHGLLSQALTMADQGIAVTAGDPSSVAAWRYRLFRAEIRLIQREPADALPALREPLPNSKAFDSLRAKQRCLNGQLQISEDLVEAVKTLQAAESLARTAGDLDVAFDARVLRGQAEMRLEQWMEAGATLSAVIKEASDRKDDYRLALALINLGRGYLGRDRFDEALPYFERAASLRRVAVRITGAALTNAGICHTRLGDFPRGRDMLTRAVEAHKTSAPRFLGEALGELGTTYLLARDIPQAITYLEEALRVARDAKLFDSAQLWASNLAAAQIERGSWDQAEHFNQQSRALRQAGDSAGLVYNILNDAQIAAGRHQRFEAATLYTAALAGAGTDPFVAAEAHAGLARLDLAEGRLAKSATRFEAALELIERTQADLARTDYKLTYLTRITRLYGEYIDTLVAQGRFERALEIADSSRARVLAGRHGVAGASRTSVREFQRTAQRSRSTLILYRLGSDRSDAWAVTPTAVVHTSLPPAAEIEALVGAYQEAITESLISPMQTASAGSQLYTMLVAPFARLLPPGAPVFVSPDGALNRLNFETLPVDGPRPHYWIEDVAVAVAPSLSMLASARPRHTSADASTVLLIGDPAPSDPKFARLQYATAEMAAVVAAFPSTIVYDGQRASPTAFREAHPERFGLIHFTAHAIANVESPLDSAVVLAPDASGYKLYARDVAAYRLDADLVTISACRSAGDRAYSGEGLVGFAWAFLHAGARRVLAGLWDVDDQSTSVLMTRVYAELAKGQTPTAALRSAKLHLIRKRGSVAKPYYWGAFVLIAAAP